MKRQDAKVLLLGEGAERWSHLRQCLEDRGCRCWFADSPEQCSSLLDTHDFHLVLSTSRAHQSVRMAPLLDRVSCRVFCCYAVRDGCW